MAKWTVEDHEHERPIKITLTPDGALIESAHPVNGGAVHALNGGEAVAFSDGCAKLRLSVDELYALRQALGGGQLEFDNRLGVDVWPSVHVERNGVGPKYRIVLEREPSFHGFPGDEPAPNARPQHGARVGGFDVMGESRPTAPPSRKAKPGVPSPNGSSKPSKGTGRARRKRGRPRKVPVTSAPAE